MTGQFLRKKTTTKTDTKTERGSHPAAETEKGSRPAKMDIRETESRHPPAPKTDSKTEIHPVPEMDIQKIHLTDSKTEIRPVPKTDTTVIHTVLQTKMVMPMTETGILLHLQAVPKMVSEIKSNQVSKHLKS